jgi:hypothetical protein
MCFYLFKFPTTSNTQATRSTTKFLANNVLLAQYRTFTSQTKTRTNQVTSPHQWRTHGAIGTKAKITDGSAADRSAARWKRRAIRPGRRRRRRQTTNKGRTGRGGGATQPTRPRCGGGAGGGARQPKRPRCGGSTVGPEAAESSRRRREAKRRRRSAD